uniref:EPS8 signaling adaptor L1a n=1 Tax=Hucho hucho TaxID=62062 RepID=A0A4W5JNS3_9TELE
MSVKIHLAPSSSTAGQWASSHYHRMGATVVSPALTSGAVSLLQKHLTDEEKELWTSLGPNWTLHCSQLVESVLPYSPVFLDGWQPEPFDPQGQLWKDPIKSQHKQDALQYSVIESSKRWWKCRNNFDQIGFVPFNILEPLSALNNNYRDSTSPTPPPAKKGPTPPCPAVLKTKVSLWFGGVLWSVSPPTSRYTFLPLIVDTLSSMTVTLLGRLTVAELFALSKEDLRMFSPEEGARVYSQMMVQKALLESFSILESNQYIVEP